MTSFFPPLSEVPKIHLNLFDMCSLCVYQSVGTNSSSPCGRTHVSDMCRLWDSQRGPQQACGPGYQALPPSGMQVLQGNLFQ